MSIKKDIQIICKDITSLKFEFNDTVRELSSGNIYRIVGLRFDKKLKRVNYVVQSIETDIIRNIDNETMNNNFEEFFWGIKWELKQQ